MMVHLTYDEKLWAAGGSEPRRKHGGTWSSLIVLSVTVCTPDPQRSGQDGPQSCIHRLETGWPTLTLLLPFQDSEWGVASPATSVVTFSLQKLSCAFSPHGPALPSSPLSELLSWRILQLAQLADRTRLEFILPCSALSERLDFCFLGSPSPQPSEFWLPVPWILLCAPWVWLKLAGPTPAFPNAEVQGSPEPVTFDLLFRENFKTVNLPLSPSHLPPTSDSFLPSPETPKVPFIPFLPVSCQTSYPSKSFLIN